MRISKGNIEMHYHPAQKKVRFYQKPNTPFPGDAIKRVGGQNFILQDQGSYFFRCITDAMDGTDSIEINFVGTQIDYEDLVCMIDDYNKQNGQECTFSCNHQAVLLSMNDMYHEVVTFGRNAIKILEECKRRTKSKRYYNDLKEKNIGAIAEHCNVIQRTLDSLESTSINVCFVGTYSSGKSSLINAIIGERILPEAVESKTAKFYIVEAPLETKAEGIKFILKPLAKGGQKTYAWIDLETTIEWNEKQKQLKLDDNRGSHPLRKDIEVLINNNKSKYKHEQFYELLDYLNGQEGVGEKIYVRYPLNAINTASMQFTLYDTPGTDSNERFHADVLAEALKEQTHSIAVFIGGVTKLEGTGNSDLLDMITGKQGKGIDLDRSLFVINRADTANTLKELKSYQTQKIKIVNKSKDTSQAEEISDNHQEVEIELKDKKLFFTSASQACKALAKKHGWIKDDDNEGGLNCRKDVEFFRFNKYGQSEAATARIIQEAVDALKRTSNQFDQYYIKDGLYSLVGAIREYGEKYAMIVKVSALIQAISEVLVELQKNADEINQNCENTIKELEKELEEIKNDITDAVEKAYNDRVLPDGEVIHIPRKTAERLTIDPNAMKKRQDDLSATVKEKLFTNKKGKKRNKKIVNEKDLPEQAIIDYINDFLKEEEGKINNKMNEVLRDQHTGFKNDVIAAIKMSELTEEGKKFLSDNLGEYRHYISNVDIQVAKIIGEAVKEKHFLFHAWAWKEIDLGKLLVELDKWSVSLFAEMAQEYAQDYHVHLNEALADVKYCFNRNAEQYFCIIQEIKTQMEAVQETASDVKKTREELVELSEKFENLIWKELPCKR